MNDNRALLKRAAEIRAERRVQTRRSNDPLTLEELRGMDGELETNADRIRAMGDEELAEFLEMVRKRRCFAEGEFPYHPCNQERNCKKCAMHWLQQPAPEEGEQNV